jgi:hypothetical protein
MTEDESKAIQFVISTLMHRLEDLALLYRAATEILSPSEIQGLRAIQQTPSFAELRSRSIERRKRVIEAVQNQTLDQLAESLGDFLGALNPKPLGDIPMEWGPAI